MAKKLIHEYTFDASGQTVTIDNQVPTKKLLLITNVTDGQIIYNFADAIKGVSNRAVNQAANGAWSTTFTLEANTQSMSDSDDLQIFVEEDNQFIEPSETYRDPVSKMRVSNPNTLIDTDFEYGPQSTKWETLELVENIPAFFVKTDSYLDDIVSIETTGNSDIVTVTTLTSHGVQAGFPIDVRETTLASCDGAFIVETAANTTVFTYKSKGVARTTTDVLAPYTQIYVGEFFSVSDIKLQANCSEVIVDGTNSSIVDTATNRIITTNSFSNGDVVIYLNGAGANIGGLDNHGLYFAKNANTTGFQLSSTIGGANVNISAVAASGTAHQFISPLGIVTDTAAANSNIYIHTRYTNPFANTYPLYLSGTRNGSEGTYTIQNIINDNHMLVIANTTIDHYEKDFDASAVGVNEEVDALNITAHGFVDGDYVVYSSNGNVSMTGLDEERAYYVIVAGADYIKLANSAADAETGSFVQLNARPSSEIHKLFTKIISGEKQALGNFSATAGDTLLIGDNDARFLQDLKIGDDIRIYNNDSIQTKSFTTGQRNSVVLYENARNTTSEIIRVDRDTSGGRVPDAAMGGAWTVGEPVYYNYNLASGTTRTRDFTNLDYNDAGNKFTNGAGASPYGSSYYVRSVAANLYDIVLSTDPKLGSNINVTSTNIQDRTRLTRPTVDIYQDVIYIPAHGFSNQDIVQYQTLTGTSVIGGLTNATNYAVDFQNSNAIKLRSYTANTIGAVMDLTSEGGTTASGHQLINQNIVTGTKLTRTIQSVSSQNNSTVDLQFDNDIASAKIYVPSRILPRSEAYAIHRPFDGGMEITTNSALKGPKIVRQTRRYFRYQSGKGIQMSVAMNFKPPIDIDKMSVLYTRLQESIDASNTTHIKLDPDEYTVFPTSGTLEINAENISYTGIDSSNTDAGILLTGVTRGVNSTTPANHEQRDRFYLITQDNGYYKGRVETVFNHNLTNTANIFVNGAEVSTGVDYYNGAHQANVIMDDYNFTFNLDNLPAQREADGLISFNVTEWSGSVLRAGMFDDQNGVFFEFDGSTLYAVRRNSTKKLSGLLEASAREQIVTGTDTKFTTQLTAGDNIVLRGASYRVQKIISDTQLEILPEYRGLSGTNIIGILTQDTKVAQTDWNMDPMDGTGPSGFQLDLSKIQMAYIDYSWYGAGAVRFGFKDHEGEVRYAHRFIHNNINRVAYFRSGNLPCRYECENIATSNYAPRLAHWGVSVIMDGAFEDDKAYYFSQSSETIRPSGDADVEIFTCQANEFIDTSETTIDIRAKSANFPASGTIQINNEQMTFTGGATSTLTVVRGVNGTTAGSHSRFTTMFGSTALGTSINKDDGFFFPVISVRLAPSVDNSVPGSFGERDITNRMQMTLKRVDIVASKECTIDLVLNGRISNALNTFADNIRPSISQYIKHSSGASDTIVGGDTIMSFKVDQQRVSVALDELATLGNSILGGNGIFPEGPDVLTVVARVNVVDWDANEDYVYATINWTESQA